jgi:hypothetical protein
MTPNNSDSAAGLPNSSSDQDASRSYSHWQGPLPVGWQCWALQCRFSSRSWRSRPRRIDQFASQFGHTGKLTTRCMLVVAPPGKSIFYQLRTGPGAITNRGLTRLIRGVISRGMIPHDRAASTDPSATSDHPERKHRRHRRPNKWSNRESGGSSRDARANHRDPHRTRHVVPIALSFFFPFVIAASSICKYNVWRHEAV